MIICGDFGAIWDGSAEDEYLLKWYQEKPWTTLFIDGNHENFDLLEIYPITEWNGGKVQFINDSVIHLMRGQVYEINDKTIFTMGGAKSIDRGPATYTEEYDIHKIWWPQENITDADMEEAWRNLDRVNNKVDYIVTHEVPISVAMQMGYFDNDMNRMKLEQIKNTVSYEMWFAGHWHRFDRYGNIQILYNQIVRFNREGELINVCEGLYR